MTSDLRCYTASPTHANRAGLLQEASEKRRGSDGGKEKRKRSDVDGWKLREVSSGNRSSVLPIKFTILRPAAGDAPQIQAASRREERLPLVACAPRVAVSAAAGGV
eukprot:superscaffoldBa00000423_g4625